MQDHHDTDKTTSTAAEHLVNLLSPSARDALEYLIRESMDAELEWVSKIVSRQLIIARSGLLESRHFQKPAGEDGSDQLQVTDQDIEKIAALACKPRITDEERKYLAEMGIRFEGLTSAVQLEELHPDIQTIEDVIDQIDGSDLPGLDVVLNAIRDDIRPGVVLRFLQAHQVDLCDELGEPMTPIDWLRCGGDMGSVVRLAREI
ncbi:hypothetical protein [Leisingera caerulea]|uniref:Uncharacterized protein n=1 Tax=Leisingera caerulea TaxID=506591 RepID=A0A9Q9M3L7_LEICA|nr:hypothetical protein [Leisingera caerulea]UWQ54728.1 hypothetical protein K3721_04145 [Leisingera caerulea]